MSDSEDDIASTKSDKSSQSEKSGNSSESENLPDETNTGKEVAKEEVELTWKDLVCMI